MKQLIDYLNEARYVYRESLYQELLDNLRGLFKTDTVDSQLDAVKIITPEYGKVNPELDKVGYWPCVEFKPKATYGWTYSKRDGRYLYEIAKDDDVDGVFWCTIGVEISGWDLVKVCVYKDKGARNEYGSFTLHLPKERS